MKIIPAIDLLGGECVRLRQGDYREVTVYDHNPASVAAKFQEAGADRLHVVDLDAARDMGRANRKKIRKIRRSFSGKIELGGGVRSEDDIEELIDLGIDYLVIGTMVARNPNIVEGWVGHYGDIFLAGIDAEDGVVRIRGWEQETQMSDEELAKRTKDIGISTIIYTNIKNDGTMIGPDIERTNYIAEVSGLTVILSGGIGTLDDVKKVEETRKKNVVGIIAGRAVYENTLDLAEAIKLYGKDGG